MSKTRFVASTSNPLADCQLPGAKSEGMVGRKRKFHRARLAAELFAKDIRRLRTSNARPRLSRPATIPSNRTAYEYPIAR
jgi:hypothetical protein